MKTRLIKTYDDYISACLPSRMDNIYLFMIIENPELQKNWILASENNALEFQRNRGVAVSTDALHKALQHCRTFFNRLVV